MERKYLFLLILISFLVVITLIFSGFVSGGEYSITYFAPYDSDDNPESNPTIENPMPFAFSLNNTNVIPVYIAAVMTKNQKPLSGENVTLELWNENTHLALQTQTNIGGYAVFYIALNVSENNETRYNYRVFLDREKNIATDVRGIVIKPMNIVSENEQKKIRLVRKEWIQSGKQSTLRIVYSVGTGQAIKDIYHFNVTDFDNKLIYENHGPFSSTGNQDQEIFFDIPVQNSNAFQKLDINFTLEDPETLGFTVVIPGGGITTLDMIKIVPGPLTNTINVYHPEIVIDTYYEDCKDDSDPNCLPSPPPLPDPPEPKPDPDPLANPAVKPHIIPEGDNLIVVGILTMMLVVYVVIQRRER